MFEAAIAFRHSGTNQASVLLWEELRQRCDRFALGLREARSFYAQRWLLAASLNQAPGQMLVISGDRTREADAGMCEAVSSRTLAQSHCMVTVGNPMQTAEEALCCHEARTAGKLRRPNEAVGVAGAVEDYDHG
jgi:hypothetical protein